MFSDDDSLFGSPSPSRSPSPALALPTKASAECIAQNVGTIALPGSHYYSELPNVSLAPPLPCPSTRTVATAFPLQVQPPCVSSTRSRVPSTTSSEKKKKQKKRKQAHPSPAPSIALPDPSVTPPPNFLRNQSALLGTAGLVAGLTPAKMQFNIPRGASLTNPIVLDDDDNGPPSSASPKLSGVVFVENEAPKLGKRSGSLTPSLDIDSALLPAPTNNEIVAMLMAHKDIYPILRNILRLIAGQKATANMAQQGMSAPSSTPMSTGPRAPPLKRRRLNRVPAGAVDWDVPYPFQEGEGPKQYRKVWEKERGKQLISQLLDLVRIAARKAAIRKYLLQKEILHRAQRAHSAPASLLGVANQPVGVSESTDHSLNRTTATLQEVASQPNGQPTLEPQSTVLPSPQLSTLPEDQETSTSLDQLISSLLSATIPGFDFTDPHINTNLGGPMNDGLIDSWMNIFQTFPVHPNYLASPLDSLPSSTQKDQQPFSTAPTPAALNETDFFDTTSAFNFDSNMHSQSNSLNNIGHSIQSMFAATQISPLLPQSTPQHPLVCDLGIPSFYTTSQSTDTNKVSASQPESPEFVDLTRMKICIPNDHEGMSESTFSIPSASSIRSSSLDPSTPASAVWESGTAIALQESQHLQEPSSSQGGDDVGQCPSQEKEHFDASRGDGQGLQLRTSSSVDQSTLQSHTPQVCPRQSKLSKDDIIRFAQERRQQLVAELERVKTQLWETTIEQGVLVELQKQLLP